MTYSMPYAKLHLFWLQYHTVSSGFTERLNPIFYPFPKPVHIHCLLMRIPFCETKLSSSILPHSSAQNHIDIYTHICRAGTLFISPTLFSQYLAYYRYHSISTHLNVVCTWCSTKCFVWFFYIKNKNCISAPSIILDKHQVKSLKWSRNKVV